MRLLDAFIESWVGPPMAAVGGWQGEDEAKGRGRRGGVRATIAARTASRTQARTARLRSRRRRANRRGRGRRSGSRSGKSKRAASSAGTSRSSAARGSGSEERDAAGDLLKALTHTVCQASARHLYCSVVAALLMLQNNNWQSGTHLTMARRRNNSVTGSGSHDF